MKRFFIGIIILGIFTFCLGERYLVLDSKDGRIIKKLSDIDSILFINAETDTTIGFFLSAPAGSVSLTCFVE